MVTYRKESLRFYGTNYSIWKNRMECHLKCLSDAYYRITKTKYNIPKNGPSTMDELREVEYNIKAKEALLSALIDTKMTNVMHLQTAHEI
jgi:hypothetical protein